MEDFSSRWQTSDGLRRRQQAIRAFANGLVSSDPLPNLLAMTEEGLVDLRGLDLPEHTRVTGKTFSGLDLSYARLGYLELIDCRFENIRFAHASKPRFMDRGSSFRRVDFAHADLRYAAIGMASPNNTGRRSEYQTVNFDHAKFTGASFLCPTFDNCDFSYAALKGIDFDGSSFKSCIFSGRLESIWFNRVPRFASDRKFCADSPPNSMADVDFSSASLWDVSYSGNVDLSSTTIPGDGLHHLTRHFPNALEAAKDRIQQAGWSDEEARRSGNLIAAYLVHAQSQDIWIINQREFCDWWGEQCGMQLVQFIVAGDEI